MSIVLGLDPAAGFGFCSIEGCSKKAERRNWCRAHYDRWRRHGDPLAGGTPRGVTVGSPERFYREKVLPNNDRVGCLIWPFARISTGYAAIGSGGQVRLVSRRVCEETYGQAPTPDHEAAHSCGRGDDGCVNRWHVSWKTPVENAADKLQHGTVTRGEQHGNAKLTEAEVHAIRSQNGDQADAAERFAVSQSTISVIRNRKSWGWLL